MALIKEVSKKLSHRKGNKSAANKAAAAASGGQGPETAPPAEEGNKAAPAEGSTAALAKVEKPD